MVKRRTGLDPLAYMGVEPQTPSQFLQDTRNPTTNDYDNFNLMAVWLNKNTFQVWMLVSKANFIATWREFTNDVGNLNTLTGDFGGAVPPTANNIDIEGSGAYLFTGNPGTSTLTLSDDGSIATTYDADSGSAIPSSNTLNIVGSGGVVTSASGNTVTITSAGSVAVQIDADTGSAVPAGGILNVVGGDSIITSASGNTVTVSVSGTTEHAVQIGDGLGGLDSIAVGTDGQVIIGATGADPAFATLTSSGGTILFTPGPNSLNLETTATPVQINCDVDDAHPIAGVLNIFGGDNITTTGDTNNTISVAVSGTTQFAPLMGNAAGSLDDVGIMTTGELMIGVTGMAPNLARLTPGTGIIIDDTTSPGEITITATGGSTGGIKRTIFNSSGTWTKDANAMLVRYVIYSGGGGGGSGARANSTGFPDEPLISGGAGGCGHGYTEYIIDADCLGASESVTVAASAPGGAAQTINDTDGNAGTAPNISFFGTSNPLAGGTDAYDPLAYALPGIIGSSSFTINKGTVINTFTGIRTLTHLPPLGQGGGVSDQTGGHSPTSFSAGVDPWGTQTGGGGGGSFQSGGVSFTGGGNGGLLISEDTGLYTYGTAGIGGAVGVSGTNGLDATAQNSPWKLGGTGGGGGGAHATNPGHGGNGGIPGGGGGGGGSCMNGNPSGAGGDGARGQVIIYEYLGFDA